MKWGFVLVTLYLGPIGLLLYVLADREPAPGTHEAFVAPLWKQSVGSAVHCVAGDATGIILAAAITAVLGLPMWVDLLVEYVAGFLFGLLIFQSLFMRAIMGGTYAKNVRRSFIPEFVSMNATMAGMAPVMITLMMGRDMRAMWPGEPLFWFVMSLGIIVGFAVAYPANVWLVSRKLNHGLMTVRAGRPHERSHESHGGSQGVDGMAAMHGDHEAKPGEPPLVTRTEIVTVTGFTLLMLAAGLYVPAAFHNLRLSAESIGRSLIMPPGMITTAETPADAMRDMAAADPRLVTFHAPIAARGDRPLAPRIENGVKVFDFDASVIQWYILPNKSVTAYAINHQVPGPRLDVTEGDHIRINYTNHLPETTTMHWHGLHRSECDGRAGQHHAAAHCAGETFVYDFTVGQSGTYFYHSHDKPDRQQALGLYGALIIRPRDSTTEPHADLEYVIQLQEWLNRDGLTYPAMLMDGGLPNYFTINGKAYPATDTLHMRVGQTMKFRFIGTNNNFIHPMHMHGGPFTVVARDGVVLAPEARFDADVINVGPGQRYDVIWKAREPGKWILHCHIPHHTLNNNVETNGAGGLTLLVEVSP